MNESYILKDSLTDWKWELTREKKQILGYETRKAIHKGGIKEVTAWYAPSIPFRGGPSIYWGLPGLILEIETIEKNPKGSLINYYYAESIDMAGEKHPIERITKGRIITSDELKALREEESKKFEEMYGGGVDTSD